MYTYTIIINGPASGEHYYFSYGHTNDISVRVSYKKAVIEKTMQKDYRHALAQRGSYLNNMIREGMKRVSLVHILKYQRPLNVRSVIVQVHNGKNGLEEYDISKELLLYSMIRNKFPRPISVAWNNHDIIQKVLSFQKSRDHLAHEMSALYAYLYSKTKDYETERFSFLWMAMNGMYSSLHPMSSPNDKQQLDCLIRRYGFGSAISSRKVRAVIGKKTSILLKDVREPVTMESLTQGEHKELALKIDGNLQKNQVEVSPYGYLLVDYSYYLRCKLFHANRPMELFSFIDDMELKSIRIVNRILEDFLDKHLVDVFQ